MDCIDGSIKLFDPDYDLRTIKGKRTNKTNGYLKHGEAQRFALGRSMSSRKAHLKPRHRKRNNQAQEHHRQTRYRPYH